MPARSRLVGMLRAADLRLVASGHVHQRRDLPIATSATSGRLRPASSFPMRSRKSSAPRRSGWSSTAFSPTALKSVTSERPGSDRRRPGFADRYGLRTASSKRTHVARCPLCLKAEIDPVCWRPSASHASRGTCRAVSCYPCRAKPPQRASGRLCRASGGLRIGNRRRRRPLLACVARPGKSFASPFRSRARCCCSILFYRGHLYRSHRYDRSDFLRWSQPLPE